MKTIISAHRKGLALALFVLAAGLCYSCVPGREPETVLAELETGAFAAQETDASAALETGISVVREADGSAARAVGEPGTGADGVKASAPASEPETISAAKVCYVHVCGEVLVPGVYRMAEGQRVFEAVELAGGFTEAAADAYLNLAEPVFDGMKVEVPDLERAKELSAAREQAGISRGGAEAAAPAKVNINTATREELMTLRGIGQARAEDILAYRQQHGGFGRIEDIMEVPGIKEAAFQKIRDDITV